jgi:hypothetical protein
MRAECVEAVAQVMGRLPTDAQIKRIESEIVANMRELARSEPDRYAAMSMAERLNEAAARAAKSRMDEAALKEKRAALQVTAAARLLDRYEARRTEGVTGARSVYEQLDQVAIYNKGVAREYFAKMLDAIEAAEPRFLGLIENAAAVRDFVREVMAPNSSGNAIAAKGAKAWLDTIEQMRVRFNAAGGNIGKLDYGYLPQAHDNARVRTVGAEQWVRDTLPLLDRSRYVDINGRPMDDGAMTAMLRDAYTTIVSDGLNKLEPGQFRGTGSRANHGSQHRVIHFTDADSYLRYMEQYGHGSVFTAMQGHVTRLARDIGLVEQMGPNPELAFRTLDDTAVRDDNGVRLVGGFGVSTRQLWSSLAGHTSQTEHVRLGEIAQGVRNVQVFGKLQGAVVSSVTDVGSLVLTARFNKLPVWDTLSTVIRSFGGETQQYANRAGLIAETIINDMNRWGESNLRDGWTSRLANTTMKVSLMNAWTDAIRRGFSVSMMAGMGKLLREGGNSPMWSQLDEATRTHLARKGVTDADWAIWRRATLEQWRGQPMLTPDAVRAVQDPGAEQAASRLLGVIADESEYASVAPDLYTRAAIERGTQRGTIEGELLRSIALFKGFPLAMISRHWGRAADTWRAGDRASAVGYGAGLAVALTTLGALAVQLKDMLAGRDPRDMTEGKFWTAAAIQGGGAGILGDLVYTGAGGHSRNGLPNWFNLAGPVVSTAAEAIDLTLGNVSQAAQGDDTNVGAEALRFARSNLPFVNLWYARAALDQAVFHELQEYLSPGYLGKMESRIRRDFGNDFWWRPGGDMLPERAPDFANAVGQ